MNCILHGKLNGRIVERYGTKQRFARCLGITPTTLGRKLNGKAQWKPKEIARICELLTIGKNEIGEYFFT